MEILATRVQFMIYIWLDKVLSESILSNLLNDVRLYEKGSIAKKTDKSP